MRVCCTSLLVLIAGLAIGCGSGKSSGVPTVTPVSGTVILDGVPLPEGSVTFHPAGGTGNPAVSLIEAGKFELSTYKRHDGAVPGKHKVTVSLPSIAPESGAAKGRKELPAMYDSRETTPIEVEVLPGKKNEIEVKLTSK